MKKCCNCAVEMQFLKRENVQLGKTGFFWGDWPNLIAGAQDLEFWICPRCRKLDFYIPEGTGEPDCGSIAQVICSVCGTKHDLDDPKCPRCGAHNPNW